MEKAHEEEALCRPIPGQLSTSNREISSMNEPVILDGRGYYEGHRDAWRAGIIVSEVDERGPSQQFVTVECQPRGKERKARQLLCCAWHLLRDTPEVRAKLAARGIDPDKQPVTRS